MKIAQIATLHYGNRPLICEILQFNHRSLYFFPTESDFAARNSPEIDFSWTEFRARSHKASLRSVLSWTWTVFEGLLCGKMGRKREVEGRWWERNRREIRGGLFRGTQRSCTTSSPVSTWIGDFPQVYRLSLLSATHANLAFYLQRDEKWVPSKSLWRYAVEEVWLFRFVDKRVGGR